MRMRHSAAMLGVLLLAGCSGAGAWTKPGIAEGAIARDYQDCRALADSAVRVEADIDQDVAATRAEDRQRAAAVRADTQAMHDSTGARAAAIIDRCMEAKGFSRAP